MVARKIKTAPKSDASTKVEAPKKEAPAMHNIQKTYQGASPVVRGHGRKLSPVVMDRVPNSFTERDHSALKDFHAAYGTKEFTRYDGDAGVLSRLIGHGYLQHVSGALDERTAKFKITEKAVKERF